MASPYSSVIVSGYNANPPPDDGTLVATNRITWAGIKAKVGDPLNTFAAAVDSANTTAWGKSLDGATVVTTAVNYPMAAADQGRLIKATAAGITITTPDATVVGAPFAFEVLNLSTGTITVAGSGAQNIDGNNTQVIKAGSGCVIRTDGSNWFTSGLKAAQITSTNPPYGFDAPINLQLNASVAASILTIAVKTNSGNDPSTSDPVLIPFRDSTVANGDPLWRSITAALSINTNAVGATLGSQNTVPFRFWILAFDNAGTVALALWHSGSAAASIAINPLDETGVASTTGISAAATSAGVFYTPNGTTLTNKSFRIIGFLTYETALATAGTYSAAPDVLQLFGPGVYKPGSVIQTQYSTTTSTTTINTATKIATSLTATITPRSKANLVKVTAAGAVGSCSSGGGTAVIFQLYRGTGTTAIGNFSCCNNPTAVTNYSNNSIVYCLALDNPQSNTSTQYGLYGKCSTGTASAVFLDTANTVGTNTGLMTLEEIVG